MIRFLYDTNCLVALASNRQAQHESTLADWVRRRAEGETVAVALPCLLEAFSVLTRLPAPLRLAPAQALAVVEEWARGYWVDLTPMERWNAFRAAAAAGIAGGQIYDGLIAACARKAGAATLVTWNLRHFARFAGPDLAVVNPLGQSG